MIPDWLPLRWLFASPPDRRLLPSGRFAGATPWLIGIMMFVMMIVAATGLALAGGARLVREGVANRYSIQIADGRASEARALAAASAAPGVTSAVAVPEAELRGTLEQWLGPVAAGDAGDLPLPALIDVELADGADPAPVAAAIKRAAPLSNSRDPHRDEGLSPSRAGSPVNGTFRRAALAAALTRATARDPRG